MSGSGKEFRSDSSADEASPRLPPSTPFLDGSEEANRTRSGSSDVSRARALSLADVDEFAHLWDETGSLPSEGRSPRAIVRSPRAVRVGSVSSNGSHNPQSERSRDNSASAAATDQRRHLQQGDRSLVSLDPEKCLKVKITLRSENDNAKPERKTKRIKTTPLVDWDKQTTVLMRRKRFDHVRGILT